MGRSHQRTVTDLTLCSKLRDVMQKESEASLDLSTGMRWGKHKKEVLPYCSKEVLSARAVHLLTLLSWYGHKWARTCSSTW